LLNLLLDFATQRQVNFAIEEKLEQFIAVQWIMML